MLTGYLSEIPLGKVVEGAMKTEQFYLNISLPGSIRPKWHSIGLLPNFTNDATQVDKIVLTINHHPNNGLSDIALSRRTIVMER